MVDSALSAAELARLERFVAAELGTAGPLRVSLLAGGRSNPTYEVSDGAHDYILRRPPHGLVLETAHDMGREVRVLRALGPTAVAVPTVAAACDDRSVLGAPFYLMPKEHGVVFRTREDTARLDPAVRATLGAGVVDTLARLHALDPEEIGLGDFGRPQGFLARQLRRWQRQWEAVAPGSDQEVSEILRALHDTMPEEGSAGVVHGDYKLDNIMFDASLSGEVVALLDWEMSTLGDTRSDVGLLLSFWDEVDDEEFHPLTLGATAHPGFPTRADLVQQYAVATGRELPDLAWYVALADFKIAVIFEQIRARHAQGYTQGDDFASVGGMVAPMLRRAQSRLHAGRV